MGSRTKQGERTKRGSTVCELKPLSEFFQKYFVVHEWSAVKNSFRLYIWSKVDSCFCWAVYVTQLTNQQSLFQNVRK